MKGKVKRDDEWPAPGKKWEEEKLSWKKKISRRPNTHCQSDATREKSIAG